MTGTLRGSKLGNLDRGEKGLGDGVADTEIETQVEAQGLTLNIGDARMQKAATSCCCSGFHCR